MVLLKNHLHTKADILLLTFSSSTFSATSVTIFYHVLIDDGLIFNRVRRTLIFIEY